MTKDLEFLNQFVEFVYEDFQTRLESYPLDIYDRELHEVVYGLLARQGTLLAEFASNPGTWTQHLAPLVHRTMSDAHITLAYILSEDSLERAREFVLYGLGQEKLAIAHLEAVLDPNDPYEIAAQIENRKLWLNSQLREFLTVVNVGSPMGKSSREMAEASGNLGLYNFNFTPFSACVHSTWQHIGRFNLMLCGNPLHGIHKVAVMPTIEPDIRELWIAAKNARKTINLVDAFAEFQDTELKYWNHLLAYFELHKEHEDGSTT